MAKKKAKAAKQRQRQKLPGVNVGNSSSSGNDDVVGTSATASSDAGVDGGFPSTLFLNDDRDDNNKKSRGKQQQQHLYKVRTLIDGYAWVVPNFFSSEECRRWIGYVEANGLMGHLTEQRGTRYLAHRTCYRCSREDDRDTARRLFDRISRVSALLDSIPPNPVGCNPNIRLYKYEKGHSFGKHVDGSVDLSSSSATKTRSYTRVTVLVYLSNCRGGATRFEYPPSWFSNNNNGSNDNDKDLAFEPREGTMLLHLHGDDCLLHQADPVLQGTKYVLRTDLAYPTPTSSR